MLLAVYRSKKTGDITTVHKLNPERMPTSPQEAAMQYNNDNKHNNFVEIVELKENSLGLFLYDRSEASIKDFKEEISEIECAVNELSNHVAALVRQGEKNDE